MKRLLAITFLFFAVAFSSLVFAQGGTNKAAAEALFQQGVNLHKQKKFSEAAEKLDASHKLDPAVGTLLYLGDCYEQLNKKASAWAAFKEAASLAQTQKDAEREKTANIRAAALLPQVSHLVVRASSSAELPGFVVRRDGVELPAATLGTPLPSDPGEVTLEASATGYKPWTKTVTIPDGGKEVTVDIPALEPSGQPAPNPTPEDPTPVPDPDTPEAPSDLSTPLLIAGIAVGVLGLGGAAAGTAFGLMAVDSRDESIGKCRTERFCTPEGVGLRNDAQDQATVSTITFIVGGVLLAGGVTLIILSQTVAVSAGAPDSDAGLTIRGSF